MIKFVLGLGNPGSRYDYTPHNIGFAILDKLAEEWGQSFRAGKGDYIYFERDGVLFIKPLTYMNLSGRVIPSLNYLYSFSPEEILVVVDDINLPPGKIRLRKKGSSGGHKGLESIIYYLGSEDFPRLRIGVGKDERMDSADYVLAKIEKTIYDIWVLKGCEGVKCVLENDIDKAMNIVNSQKEDEIA